MQIYKITNLINNKIYVGQDSKNRKDYFGSGKLIKNAIDKHRINNFKKEILEECSKENANEIETIWIQKLKAYDRGVGYNISKTSFGGDTISNNPNKEKIINKIKSSMKGKNVGELNGSKKIEVRNQISNTLLHMFKNGREAWNKGKYGLQKHSKKSKEKISNSCRGENNSMYGKSIKDVWIEKYGIEEANKREKERNQKHKNTLKVEKKILCKHCNKYFYKRNYTQHIRRIK